MAPVSRFPLRWLLLFTTVPTLLVGALLWLAAGLVPSCPVFEYERLPSPDQRFDLVLFGQTCGADSEPNRQAALLPRGDAVPDDATSFLAIGAATTPSARWSSNNSLAMTLPAGATIYRQDRSVAGVPVSYD